MKNLISNQNGSISSLALLLTFLVLAYSFSNIATSLEELNSIKFRNKSYLCAKVSLRKLENYSLFMERLNKIIKLNFYLQLSPDPIVGRTATAAVKTSVLAQNAYHAAYIVKLKNINECQLINILDLQRTTPARTRAIFKLTRNMDRTVKMRKKWKNKMIFKAPRNISSIKYSFMIELSNSLQGSLFSRKLVVRTKEVGSKGIYQLKQLDGL